MAERAKENGESTVTEVALLRGPHTNAHWIKSFIDLGSQPKNALEVIQPDIQIQTNSLFLTCQDMCSVARMTD